MRSSRPLPGVRYEALLRVLRATEALWEASRVFFDYWELSPSQFNLLKLLYDHPDGATQIELSRQLIMHRSNVTGLVDRLERRCLVKRREVHSDRRVYHVVLTARGRALLLRILPRWYEITEQVWADLSRRDAERLASELETMVAQAHRLLQEAANLPSTAKGES